MHRQGMPTARYIQINGPSVAVNTLAPVSSSLAADVSTSVIPNVVAQEAITGMIKSAVNEPTSCIVVAKNDSHRLLGAHFVDDDTANATRKIMASVRLQDDEVYVLDPINITSDGAGLTARSIASTFLKSGSLSKVLKAHPDELPKSLHISVEDDGIVAREVCSRTSFDSDGLGTIDLVIHAMQHGDVFSGGKIDFNFNPSQFALKQDFTNSLLDTISPNSQIPAVMSGIKPGECVFMGKGLFLEILTGDTGFSDVTDLQITYQFKDGDVRFKEHPTDGNHALSNALTEMLGNDSIRQETAKSLHDKGETPQSIHIDINQEKLHSEPEDDKLKYCVRIQDKNVQLGNAEIRAHIDSYSGGKATSGDIDIIFDTVKPIKALHNPSGDTIESDFTWDWTNMSLNLNVETNPSLSMESDALVSAPDDSSTICPLVRKDDFLENLFGDKGFNDVKNIKVAYTFPNGVMNFGNKLTDSQYNLSNALTKVLSDNSARQDTANILREKGETPQLIHIDINPDLPNPELGDDVLEQCASIRSRDVKLGNATMEMHVKKHGGQSFNGDIDIVFDTVHPIDALYKPHQETLGSDFIEDWANMAFNLNVNFDIDPATPLATSGMPDITHPISSDMSQDNLDSIGDEKSSWTWRDMFSFS